MSRHLSIREPSFGKIFPHAIEGPAIRLFSAPTARLVRTESLQNYGMFLREVTQPPGESAARSVMSGSCGCPGIYGNIPAAFFFQFPKMDFQRGCRLRYEPEMRTAAAPWPSR